jgi:hypothetical protein
LFLFRFRVVGTGWLILVILCRILLAFFWHLGLPKWFNLSPTIILEKNTIEVVILYFPQIQNDI